MEAADGLSSPILLTTLSQHDVIRFFKAVKPCHDSSPNDVTRNIYNLYTSFMNQLVHSNLNKPPLGVSTCFHNTRASTQRCYPCIRAFGAKLLLSTGRHPKLLLGVFPSAEGRLWSWPPSRQTKVARQYILRGHKSLFFWHEYVFCREGWFSQCTHRTWLQFPTFPKKNLVIFTSTFIMEKRVWSLTSSFLVRQRAGTCCHYQVVWFDDNHLFKILGPIFRTKWPSSSQAANRTKSPWTSQHLIVTGLDHISHEAKVPPRKSPEKPS